MAYTVTQLITGAYYASGVVAREFETVKGGELGDALLWLNDILAEKNVDEAMVPYETTYNFNAIIGTEKYFVPGLVKVDTLVFYLQEVRYAMKYTPRNQYFGSSRVENIQTLPYQWYFERGFGGGTIYIYFKPDQNYPIEIHGVFQPSAVSLNQDLSLTLDEFYITYLRYALADRICAEFEYTTPVNVMRQLSKYESLISKKSRFLDLSIGKVSTLEKRGCFNWAFINLGKGWSRPG
jgi:hypothetical protein